MADLKMPTLPAKYRFRVEAYKGPSTIDTGTVILEVHRGQQWLGADTIADPRESKNGFLRALGYMFGIYKTTRKNIYREYWYPLNSRIIENTDEGIVKGAKELSLWLYRQQSFESRVGTYPPKTLDNPK